jgi:phage shock protein E
MKIKLVLILLLGLMSMNLKLWAQSSEAGLQNMVRKGAFLVDVRTPQEFAQGHVQGSVNIPLDQVQSNLSQFKGKKNIVVFCRSGNRSTQAKRILDQNGIKNVYNGGTWMYVNQLKKS